MNQPWVYMCSPSWTPLPPPSPSHPSESSQCTSPECPVSCIEPGLVIYFTYGNIYVSVLFSQSSHTCLLPQSTNVCFLHLCLFCCLAYRVLVGWHSIKLFGIQPPLLNSKVTLAKFSFSWSVLNLPIWKINLCLMGLLWRLNYLAYRGLLL